MFSIPPLRCDLHDCLRRSNCYSILARHHCSHQSLCRTFGIPDECATGSGPEFTATTTHQLLKEWGVHHLQSVAFLHSNFHSEVDLKTVKCLITDNTDAHGSCDLETPYNVPYSYVETPLNPTQNCLQQSMYLEDQSRS